MGVLQRMSVKHSPQPLTPPNVELEEGELRLLISRGKITLKAPHGWRDSAAVQRDIAAIRPALLRALAPDLPPVEAWPSQWVEAWEVFAVAHQDAGTADDLAAYDDLRVAVWVGSLPSWPAV